MDRLSAAAYAASGTGHHFYEIIVHFAALDHIQQSPGISKSADNRDPYSNIINGKFRFHNPVVFLESGASDHLKGICRRILLFQDVVSRTKCCFHYTSGRSEDHACAGAFLHRPVAFDIFQRLRADMGGTDHFRQFSGRQYRVNIMACVFFIKHLHLTLALLCHAGHDGQRIDLLRRNSQLICKIGLHHRSKHLLR